MLYAAHLAHQPLTMSCRHHSSATASAHSQIDEYDSRNHAKIEEHENNGRVKSRYPRCFRPALEEADPWNRSASKENRNRSKTRTLQWA